MLKTILLITPLYVTLIWSVVLNIDYNKHSYPKALLGKVMIQSFLVYLFNFIFFIPLTSIYPYMEPLYQYASMLGYPLFYIYTRLLTVDQKFTIKKHGRYLLAPTLLFLFYVIGIMLTPYKEYATWVFHRNDFQSTSDNILFLKLIIILIRTTIIIQTIIIIIACFSLIRKYGTKAARYYSDIEDSGTQKLQLMNIAMVIIAIVSLTWTILGRFYFSPDMNFDPPGPTIVSILISTISSTMYFILGWLGFKQVVLNPTFELLDEPEKKQIDLQASTQRLVKERLTTLFDDNKIYLNSKLTLQDVAQTLGTNRTYISNIINQNYNQNFCNFVNDYRVDELEKIVLENPSVTLEQLTESCGFGSVNSLKRAFYTKKQISYPAWKSQNLPK